MGWNMWGMLKFSAPVKSLERPCSQIPVSLQWDVSRTNRGVPPLLVTFSACELRYTFPFSVFHDRLQTRCLILGSSVCIPQLRFSTRQFLISIFQITSSFTGKMPLGLRRASQRASRTTESSWYQVLSSCCSSSRIPRRPTSRPSLRCSPVQRGNTPNRRHGSRCVYATQQLGLNRFICLFMRSEY